MDYDKEAYEALDSFRKKYTVEEIIAISRRLLALSVSCFMVKNEFDEQQKNEIFEGLKKSIPRDIEDCLSFIAKHVSDPIP